MNSEEMSAWAAGFFDGEGNVHLSKDTVKYKHPVLVVGQSGDDGVPEALRRFHSIVGCGQIYGPLAVNVQGYLPDGKPRYYLKPRYQWRVSNWDGVSAVLMQLIPYMSTVKVRQAMEVLFRYSDSREQQPRLRVGKDDALQALLDMAATRLNYLEEVH